MESVLEIVDTDATEFEILYTQRIYIVCACARVCVFRSVLSYLFENYKDLQRLRTTSSTIFQGHDIMATDD